MVKPKMHTDFMRAIKNCSKEHPFSLLPAQIPESSGPYRYPMRKTTVATTVKLYQPILEAFRMYTRKDETFIERPYILIAQAKRNLGKNTSTKYYLETVDADGSTIVVSVVGNVVRISKVDASDANDRSPALSFMQQSSLQLTAVALALIPYVLTIDTKEGNSLLFDAINNLGEELADAANWTSKDDIPDLTKEHLYFSDAAMTILNSEALDFGDIASAVPEEVNNDFFTAAQAGPVTGALVCENRNNGWTPRFLASNGTNVKKVSKKNTIAHAKQQYSSYSANRSWTAMEQMLIPSFPDDMPVMPEVIRMADRICNTAGDTNPVCNIMWRSDTGYGKSTGTRQLACILNIPHLVMTCHPGMEIQEFKSNFVPSTADGIELDMSSVSIPAKEEQTQDRPPFFEEAMSYVATLNEQQKDELFDAKKFYNAVMVEDTEELSQSVIGSRQNVSVDDLCWLYGEIRSATMREEPLRKRVKQLEATAASEPEKGNRNKPEFVHVVSNYVKAMVNGYMVEIQEASRIRDSGVLVGLNEFDRPGAVIPLMNGALARRHKDAICIITDNVGYASCRPIDPSVLRRQGLIIDSCELTQEQLLERVKRNTNCSDNQLLLKAYSYWKTVKEYCEQNSITEGSTSPMELERFVQALIYDGLDALETDLDDCVISKATSSIEDQKGIRTACQIACVN